MAVGGGSVGGEEEDLWSLGTVIVQPDIVTNSEPV